MLPFNVGPREMLKYFKGYLQTDGYKVYEEFGKQEGIVLIHCMAHARRKFIESLANDKARSEYVLAEIQKLYAIERHIQDHALSAEDTLNYRLANAKPILLISANTTSSKLTEQLAENNGEMMALLFETETDAMTNMMGNKFEGDNSMIIPLIKLKNSFLKTRSQLKPIT
jgi:hypothetical protein